MWGAGDRALSIWPSRAYNEQATRSEYKYCVLVMLEHVKVAGNLLSSKVGCLCCKCVAWPKEPDETSKMQSESGMKQTRKPHVLQILTPAVPCGMLEHDHGVKGNGFYRAVPRSSSMPWTRKFHQRNMNSMAASIGCRVPKSCTGLCTSLHKVWSR
jgi:hypothetical protein